MSGFGDPIGPHDAGEAGEAATAALISDVLGDDLVHQHTPGDIPQGIDVAYHRDGELHVAEVKSVLGDWHQPATARTVDGRQMDADWVADRLDAVGLDVEAAHIGPDDGQIHTELYQVDYPGETIARYDLGLDGRRTDTAPQEVYSLADVLDVHAALDEPEALPAEEPVAEGEAEIGEAPAGEAGAPA